MSGYDLAPRVTLERQPLPGGQPPEGFVHLVLEIENSYELHPDVITYASVTVPTMPDRDLDPAKYEDWVYEEIINLTGVGHTNGKSFYDIEVLESSDPDLIGATWDWGY